MKSKAVKGRRPVRVIAAAAAAVTVPTGYEVAQAQSNTVPSFTPKTMMSVEGGFLFSDYRPLTASNGKLGGNTNNVGGYGAISFGQDINPLYDWRVSGAFNAFQKNSQSSTTTGSVIVGFIDTNTASDRFDFFTFDFDVGRRWENGNLQLRTFAGLRALRSNNSFETTDVLQKLGTTVTSQSGDSHFTGVGPRIGLEVFYGSTFGIVGSASAAAIWGVRNSNFTANLDGSLLNMGQNRWTWVENVSGSLGFSWQFAPGANVVVGYRADAWWNIREDFSFTGMNFQGDKDLLAHGPFLRVVVRR